MTCDLSTIGLRILVTKTKIRPSARLQDFVGETGWCIISMAQGEVQTAVRPCRRGVVSGEGFWSGPRSGVLMDKDIREGIHYNCSKTGKGWREGVERVGGVRSSGFWMVLLRFVVFSFGGMETLKSLSR